MPYCPDKGDKAYFEIVSINEKIVAEYANISLLDINNMEIFTYWGLLHDAVVYNCNKTEQGRKYLEDAWILSQTKADKKSLRENFSK